VETKLTNVQYDLSAEAMLEHMSAVRKPRDRPRWKLVSLAGDAGYGFAALIAAVAPRRIILLLPEPARSLHQLRSEWSHCVVA